MVGVACGGIDEPNFFSSGSTSPTALDGGTGNVDSGRGGNGDAGDTIVDSGSVIPDSGVILPADPGIFCGTDVASSAPIYCTGKQICCASNDQFGTPTYQCGDEAACTGSPLGDLVIPCDDTQECGSKICCGTFVTGSPSYYSQVRCAASCTGTAARIFCNPANGNAECTGTDVCEASGALPGFTVCGQP